MPQTQLFEEITSVINATTTSPATEKMTIQDAIAAAVNKPIAPDEDKEESV
jgi:hypothetical protein